MNQGWIYQDRVRRQDVGLTVLEFYTRRYPHSTLAEWRTRIDAAQITVNGQPTPPEATLQAGQHLAYQRPPWQEPDVPLTFTIQSEDADLLVIAKPAGLPVLPGGGFLEHTLLGQLQLHYPNATPYPIHRLGRGTSGLLLLARSPFARAALSQQMRDRQIRKTYRALIGPSDLPDTFTMTQAIGKIPHPTLGYIYGATPAGQFALSEGQVLERRSHSTLLAITILTGRPHQIRIHLASLGYPLLGDPLYMVGGLPRLMGDRAAKLPVPGDCGYHLHAHQLHFTHPRTQTPLHLYCPPPPDLSLQLEVTQIEDS